MKKISADEALWFRGTYDNTAAGNGMQVYVAPVDLIDEESLNKLHHELFIYKTKFNTDINMRDLTKDQFLVGAITTDWYVVSRHRLSIHFEIKFDDLHITSSYYKPGHDLMYGDLFKQIGSFFECAFFNRKCIGFRADKELLDNHEQYISNFLGYIVRKENLNVFKVVRNVYIIGKINEEEMVDYCTNTFESIDDVIGYYGTPELDLWVQVIPAVAE